MREALGLVETRGLSNAILVADVMSKTANVNIIGLENSRGLGYMTVKITGDVGAVNAAVTSGKKIAIENNSFVTAKVIPRPSNDIEVTFCQLNNKKDDIPKEDITSEKNNNDESIVETDNTTKMDNEIEPLNNNINAVEKLEDKVEEIEKVEELVETEKDKIKEGKSKTRKGSRKKAEPKNEEE